MNRPRRIQLLFVAMTAIAASAGCESKPAKKEPAPIAVDLVGEIQQNAGLLKLIPPSAYGFFEWNATDGAYRKFANSVWSSDDVLGFRDAAGGVDHEFFRLLRRAGLDPTNRKTFETIFAHAVIFVAQPPEENKLPTMAILFRATKTTNLPKVIDTFRSELEHAKLKIVDEEIDGATVFRFEYEAGRKRRRRAPINPDKSLFLGWRENIGVISDRRWPIEHVFAGGKPALPGVVTSERFRETIAQFPAAAQRYSLGYFNVKELVAYVNQVGSQREDLDIPIQSMAWTSAIDEAPISRGRMLYDATGSSYQSYLRAIGTTNSKELAERIPDDAFLFLSLDGRMVRSLLQASFDNGALNERQLAPKSAVIDDLTRVGLFARMAPSGQSLLPIIPDIALLLTSSNPKHSVELTTALMTSSGVDALLGGAGWQEKKIGTTSVRYARSPLGPGIYLASSENLILLTSTEALLRQLLEKPTPAAPASTIPSKLNASAKQVFLERTSLANFYFDFQRFSKFVGSIEGLTSNYLSQEDPLIQELPSLKRVKEMAKMGTSIGEITIDDKAIEWQLFFQPTNTSQ